MPRENRTYDQPESTGTGPKCSKLSPGEAEFCVLCTFWSEHCPLTQGELQTRTGLSDEHLSAALASLQSSGHVIRVVTEAERYIGLGAVPR